jgi:hypothetical protein
VGISSGRNNQFSNSYQQQQGGGTALVEAQQSGWVLRDTVMTQYHAEENANTVLNQSKILLVARAIWQWSGIWYWSRGKQQCKPNRLKHLHFACHKGHLMWHLLEHQQRAAAVYTQTNEGLMPFALMLLVAWAVWMRPGT